MLTIIVWTCIIIGPSIWTFILMYFNVLCISFKLIFNYLKTTSPSYQPRFSIFKSFIMFIYFHSKMHFKVTNCRNIFIVFCIKCKRTDLSSFQKLHLKCIFSCMFCKIENHKQGANELVLLLFLSLLCCIHVCFNVMFST